MAFEDEALERAYPYRTGWRNVGCTVLFLALLGSGAFFLLPAGWDKIQQGNLPVGVALIVIGMFGLPLLVMALAALAGGVRDAVNPPLLRVSTTSLTLPTNLRENSTEAELDEHGDPKHLSQPPVHPVEIPFAAIRWVRREGPHNPGSDKMMIVHDLSQQTLVVEQHMMDAGDFDELETVLRAAIPDAFAGAPPT